MFLKYCLILYMFLGTECDRNFYKNSSTIVSFDESDLSSRVLSRTKRYLTFSDGSSLQLVFCCQTPALLPFGDIFLYSSTVALGWNLPSDSKFLLMFKKYEKTSQRRGDQKHVYYVDEDGKFLARVPDTKRPIINPAFAKRSIDDLTIARPNKIDRAKMHEIQSKRDLLKETYLDTDSIQFHRKNRVEIYERLMSVVTALGGDGRRCVLRKLCDTAKISRQGAFLEELLRVVFTLPKGKELDEERYKDFDRAHSANNDCDTLYPGCSIEL